MDSLLGSSRGCALILVAWLVATVAQAESLTAEARQAVRAATLEVVLPKADSDTLSYEKPLPLDLIPYIIRNDHYWSIGPRSRSARIHMSPRGTSYWKPLAVSTGHPPCAMTPGTCTWWKRS
jgi:hypothetical protein